MDQHLSLIQCSFLAFCPHRVKERVEETGTGNRKDFVLLEELVILLIKADGVLAPKLLRLVHWAPLQAAGLELRAVLIE